jgi:hypothetical protein
MSTSRISALLVSMLGGKESGRKVELTLSCPHVFANCVSYEVLKTALSFPVVLQETRYWSLGVR